MEMREAAEELDEGTTSAVYCAGAEEHWAAARDAYLKQEEGVMSFIRWFKSFFVASVPAAPQSPPPPAITAEALERLIDEAGRQRVFARAEALGWGAGSLPPMWVWASIAREIIAARQTRADLTDAMEVMQIKQKQQDRRSLH